MHILRAIMLAVTLLAVFTAGVGTLLLRELQAANVAAEQTPTEPVLIEIVAGDTTSDIATKLAAAGLIRQPILFTSLVRANGYDEQLRTGLYVFAPGTSMSEMLAILRQGSTAEVEVTIPEGLRLEEVAERFSLASSYTTEEFLAVARDGAAFKDDYFLLSSLPDGASLEGYLFPDTYNISATATPEETVRMLLDNFNRRYSTIEREVLVPNASVHDIVTMASIVQREAARTDEMPLIAAVFWNRLEPANAAETGGGKLQADPTVQYALGYSEVEETWWRKNLSVGDLTMDNPYNTRINNGLPPGPISNPGLDALRGAARPAEEDYLYFVASCAGDGTHNFARTLGEFQDYEAEYLLCSSE